MELSRHHNKGTEQNQLEVPAFFHKQHTEIRENKVKVVPVGLGMPMTLTKNWARSCSLATTSVGDLINSGAYFSSFSEIHSHNYRA